MGLIVSLILFGLILIFAEVLLIPGVGVAGILGLISMAGSCFYAFHEIGNTAGYIVTGINAVLLIALVIYILRAKTWKKMALETNIDSKAVSQENLTVSVGDIGKTMTRLAPMGSVRFGDAVVEVKAIEGMIDPACDVEIVMIEDNKIYVSPVVEIN